MTLSLILLAALAAGPQEPASPPPAPEQQQPSAQEVAPSKSTDGHIEAGLALFRKKRFVAARSHFEKAVEADPSSAAANFYLGYTIYKIAEPKRPFHPEKQKAAELFAKAYELDPAFKPVWTMRGSRGKRG